MLIIELIILLYFGYTTLYSLIFLVAGFFYKDTKFDLQDSKQQVSKFCVLIPAYKEDSVILHALNENLKISYPQKYADIVVIADSLHEDTLNQLKKLPIRLCVVSFESSTKVKALNEAFTQLPDDYDYALILDADNTMENDLIQKLSQLHSFGHQAIQVQRAPKNHETNIAVLDGLSEAVNYAIISKGGHVLGLSPGLKGSGMSFKYSLIKKTLGEMISIGGFDRELELRLIRNNINIYYSHNAKVFDQKVSSVNVFKNQRTRWISSQFHYLKTYLRTGISALFNGNINFFNSAVLRNVQLPRILNLGLLIMLTILFLLFQQATYLDYKIWIALLLLNIAIILIAIPAKLYSKKLFLALFEIPVVLLNMIMILFRLQGANKKFIHTPKSTITKT
ncbi:MAG: glycosyltransferase [Cyclobacteriaceae bacterium]|nr:glycosyltransferase [Cyclobacteriaceae bacterium]